VSTAEPPRLTRRTCTATSATLLASFECGGATLLASFECGGLLSLKQGLAAQETATADLAANRPVSVSSTDCAPTPGSFAVEGAVATVSNDGSVMAAMVRLAVRNKRTGDRVLPARYDDNSFWLRPGERRQIAIDWPADALDSGTWNVTAEAYNR
jgi:hypothetical protein